MAYVKHTRLAGIFLAVALISGCDHPQRGEPLGPPPPARPVAQVIEVVDKNGHRFDQPLYGHVSTSAKLVDEKGQAHKFDLRGRLAMQPPRSMWLRLDHALDADQMEVGSNDTEYWLKIRQDVKTLWWGHHENLGKPCSDAMMVDPQLVADALGTAPLPPESRTAKRKTERRFDRLTWLDTGRVGWRRELAIDRYPPYMVMSVIYRDGQNEIQLIVNRDDFKPVGKDGPLVPRYIEVQWPRKGSWMKFKIEDLAVRTPNPQVFVRPTAPSGVNQIVQVDAACPSAGAAAPVAVPEAAAVQGEGR